MTRALLAAAAFGLSIAGANACEFQHTAGKKTDNMTVASTTATHPMSMADTTMRSDTVRTDRVKDDIVRTDEQG